MGVTEWDLGHLYSPSRIDDGPTVDVQLSPTEWRAALLADAREGLAGNPKELSPKWLYDEAGSELFDRITRVPEYYPTRRERALIEAQAAEIAILARADTLVELGSGTSEKTRLLLDALRAGGGLERFVPFDVSEGTLRRAAGEIARAYPGLRVHAVVGDFERHLAAIPQFGQRLIAFLGGTIGNFKHEPRLRFFEALHAAMNPGDTLLLGADLLKDERRLVAAYDDVQGVTAAFDLNVLRILNRELEADFDPDRFVHHARFDPVESWIEMLLLSREEQDVTVPALGRIVHFEPGEPLRTEVSTKFDAEALQVELSAVGFAMDGFWTDDLRDYSLSLWRR